MSEAMAAIENRHGDREGCDAGARVRVKKQARGRRVGTWLTSTQHV
jgi:hypothetical protein